MNADTSAEGPAGPGQAGQVRLAYQVSGPPGAPPMVLLHGAALPAITAPTLVIGGGPDSHVPQAKLAETAALIPHCDLVTIPAGHDVHVARPVEFADTVLHWLAGVS